jgi:hypothetical protein
VFLDANLVSWSSKRQNVVSRSSAEAEYRAMTNGVAEACWLRQLLVELHSPLSRATLVYCNNVNVDYLSTNPVQHQRTKHVEIDLSLCLRARCHRGRSCSPRPDNFSVRRHLHQGVALLGVLRVSVQSQHLQWLVFRLREMLESLL